MKLCDIIKEHFCKRKLKTGFYKHVLSILIYFPPLSDIKSVKNYQFLYAA